jgi:hypothetical protein
VAQSERLERLNRITIDQMKLLTTDRRVGKLENLKFLGRWEDGVPAVNGIGLIDS